MITKAVIAAAGRGTRFLPVTKAYPKELVPILSKPNLQYLIEEAIGAGITDIAIIIRSGEDRIQNYFSPDQNLEKYLLENNKIEYLDSLKSIWAKAKLTFIQQPTNLPYGTGSPLLAAKEFVGSDNFVYMYGDDMVTEPVTGQFLTRMISIFDKNQAVLVIAVKDVGIEEISRYGAVQYIDDHQYNNRVLAILEKLPSSEAPSTFAQCGRFVANSKVFAILESQSLSKDNELWFADTENTLSKTDIVLTESFGPDEDWLTTGDPLRWLKANITCALQDPKLKDDLSKFIANI